MSKKKTRGFTLVELTVAISLLTLLTAGLGYTMYAAFQNYQANQKMLEDEYNARNSLLFITREAHSGANVTAMIEHGTDSDGDGLNDVGSEVTLTAKDEDGVTIIYRVRFYMDDNTLRREIVEGSTLMPFKEVELDEFNAELRDDDKRLNISIKCRNGMNLETTVSLSRTQ